MMQTVNLYVEEYNPSSIYRVKTQPEFEKTHKRFPWGYECLGGVRFSTDFMSGLYEWYIDNEQVKKIIRDGSSLFRNPFSDPAGRNYFTLTRDMLVEIKPQQNEDGKKPKASIETIFDNIKSLVLYKDAKYGNSANRPLDIFGDKAKYGRRLDEKLARVKNSEKLSKNDIADLIGGCVLICQEFGWDNFDEFKD